MVNPSWEIVIGLETHAQLSTVSKMFSGSSTAFGAAPNTQASAVDIALPGVLPVANRGAVERAIRFGLAVNGGSSDNINRRSVFARKNYFYPDLPKGYQISQLDLPIVKGGGVTILSPTRGEITVKLTRAHLEEDAGKSLHEDFQGMSGIDLNRAGTPLLEIVSEPDMRSAGEAVAYAKALHGLVTWIGICDGNMQEGSFRCDANVSVRRPGGPLGTRREIKNLNSFRFLQQAIEYEARWQIETIEDGGTVKQATVLFDPDTGETRSMRSKEDAHDYRYFPDPDLLPVRTADLVAKMRSQVPELPHEKRARFEKDYGCSAYDAGVLASEKELAAWYETAVAADTKVPAKKIANWVINDLLGALNDRSLTLAECPVKPEALSALVATIEAGKISNNQGKEVFTEMFESGKPAAEIIKAKGFEQVSDTGALEAIVEQILAANPDKVAEVQAGNEKAMNWFTGQAMKASQGKANPKMVTEIVRKKVLG